MKISVITDEISRDPMTAIELATEWGIKHFEIRRLFGRRVPDVTPREVKVLKDMLDQTGTDVVALSPGIFKVRIDDENAVKEHLTRRLPDSIELAKTLGTNVIVIFGFVGNKNEFDRYFDRIVSLLGEASDLALEENVILALENEHKCLTDTGEKITRIVKVVNSRSLLINWDPGNSCMVGDERPFPDGYRYVKDFIIHMHIKNCAFDRESNRKIWTTLTQGEIPIYDHIKALKQDGYKNFISLETHLRPKVRKTKENWKALLKILEKIGEKPE